MSFGDVIKFRAKLSKRKRLGTNLYVDYSVELFLKKHLPQQTLYLLLFCRNEFAYASSDKLVYIRQFSDRGAEMTLSAVLQGHEAEVTQVRGRL